MLVARISVFIFAISFAVSAMALDPLSCGERLGLIGTSLISNITALAAASSFTPHPHCEVVKRSATCSATFYGKGDGFGGGTTACGDRYRPLQDKTVAIKTVDSGGFFSKSFCGKKAIITTRDPASGTSRSVEVRVTDSGGMGGSHSGRCMDLSYRAAFELGIVKRGVATHTQIEICNE